MRGATQIILNANGYYENFNSRAPCGAQLYIIGTSNGLRVFQLTRPMRGATLTAISAAQGNKISTHAPHAGRNTKIIVNALKPF